MTLDPREVVVPVVGGHAGVTILPLLSQAKAGAGLLSSEVLQILASRVYEAMQIIVECAFVASHVTVLPFFASKVLLGRCGVDEVYGLGPLNEYERMGLEKAKKEPEGSIAKGVTFVKK
ncbi:hypothetical protein Bca101_009877 [Brassica carinata]